MNTCSIFCAQRAGAFAAPEKKVWHGVTTFEKLPNLDGNRFKMSQRCLNPGLSPPQKMWLSVPKDLWPTGIQIIPPSRVRLDLSLENAGDGWWIGCHIYRKQFSTHCKYRAFWFSMVFLSGCRFIEFGTTNQKFCYWSSYCKIQFGMSPKVTELSQYGSLHLSQETCALGMPCSPCSCLVSSITNDTNISQGLSSNPGTGPQ